MILLILKHKQRSIVFILVLIILFCSGCSGDHENEEEASDASSGSASNVIQTTQDPDQANSDDDGTTHLNEVPEGYVGIYTVDDLINSGINKTASYILMNDIDLSSVADWTPIDNEAVFDGNHYTIYNLKSTQGGLFSTAGTVRNLQLSSVSIDINLSAALEVLYSNIAAINHSISIARESVTLGCIAATAVEVDTCSATGAVQFTLGDDSLEPGYIIIGGLVGKIINSANSCSSDLAISANDIPESNDVRHLRFSGVGGLFGWLGTKDSDSHVAVDNCIFTGSISGNMNLGGIAAVYGEDADCAFTFNNCVFAGEITSSNYSEYDDTNRYSMLIASGGIVARSGVASFTNCVNKGSFEFTQNGAAMNYGGIYGIGGANCQITNSFSAGKLLLPQTIDDLSQIGALTADFVDYVEISHCAYLNTIEDATGTAGAMIADCVAMTEDEMKDIDNYPFSNKEEWENMDDTYPVYIGIGDYER